VSKPPKAFDVWFLTANTVYKSVPYGVVAEWTQGGRLATTDKVRPAGTTVHWVDVGKTELLADFVPRPTPSVAVPSALAAGMPADAIQIPVPSAADATTHAELPEAEELTFRRPPSDEDDDVDMIPLIDVSMVLLVFFILMRAAGAVSPVDVPEMRYAGQLSNDPEAITINIEKKDELNAFYSIRQGQGSPSPENDNLKTPEEAIKALDLILVGLQRPPEVRVACRKDLPRERVYEIRRELESRLKKGQINSFTATVLEAPKEK
jgi:biopolymer transport protein ExbD